MTVAGGMVSGVILRDICSHCDSHKCNRIILKKKFSDILRILFPFLLGGAILYWMYRNFPFSDLGDILLHRMHWEWMLLSFIPGIFAQVFRGLRWKQTLAPLDEHPRTGVCINAIFLSYAASLMIPRIGEVTRCGVLRRQDGTSFPKSLGTVVTERIVDSLLVMLLCAVVFLWQLPVFMRFFDLTGVGISGILNRFTTAGILVTVILAVCILVFALLVLRRLSIYKRLKNSMKGLWAGVLSLKGVRNIPLYMVYSLGIWIAYFLHYYLTFFCFDFTANLGLTAGLVSFFVGTIAVIVPTPNGAGSWHFAVKTILVLFGLGQTDAVAFVLIVHSVQTLLLILLGIYALFVLQFLYKPARKEVRP